VPVHEVLFPPLRDIHQEFENNFAGMTVEPVELDVLLAAREQMVRELQQGLTTDERRFLLSLVAAEPDWSLLGVPHLEKLPGLASSRESRRRGHRQGIRRDGPSHSLGAHGAHPKNRYKARDAREADAARSGLSLPAPSSLPARQSGYRLRTAAQAHLRARMLLASA